MSELVQIDCGDALGIADVGELYTSLLSAIADGKAIELEISRLERVDAAALQMLYSLAKTLAEHGDVLTWSQPSQAFIEGVNLLGLAAWLNIEHNSDDAVD
jgi:anti-anti-sigma regulatory factor